jgi:hypothetical protein
VAGREQALKTRAPPTRMRDKRLDMGLLCHKFWHG